MSDGYDFYEDCLGESEFEKEIKRQLLVDFLQQHRAEVFENIVFNGTRRYYIEDLTQRDYSLEHTTPYQIKIEETSIEEGSWVNMICKISLLLLSKYPEKMNDIYNFRCSWSRADIFTENVKCNYKKLRERLYVNCNHTALHACWLIQDLLDYFNIDKHHVYFLIHRPSGSEPKKVCDYIDKRFKRGFTYLLKEKYGKDDEYANKVLANIDKHLNKLLKTISKGYVSFFLFDDKNKLYSYVKKVRELVDKSIKYDAKAKKVLNKYLDYITLYYRKNNLQC